MFIKLTHPSGERLINPNFIEEIRSSEVGNGSIIYVRGNRETIYESPEEILAMIEGNSRILEESREEAASMHKVGIMSIDEYDKMIALTDKEGE